MTTYLETMTERDARLVRERRMRIFWRISGYVAAAIAGALIASVPVLVHGFNRGVDHEKKRAADAPKPTTPAPASALTQWNCTAQEFREHFHACKQRARSDRAIPSKE
jgi:hypothetical protein